MEKSKVSKFQKIVTLLAVLIIFNSCVSAPANKTPTLNDSKALQEINIQNISSENEGIPVKEVDGLASKTDAEVETLLSKAKNAIDSNHLSEGIKFYISAYAIANSKGNSTKLNEISAILSDIGARLSIEPHESWLNPDGSQKNANIKDLAKGSGLMPAVYLYENYAYVKSPVPDAFIRFEFISNSGKLTESVTTDSKGLANTNISSIEDRKMDIIVRAYPVFTDGKYSYAYKTVLRDFSFVASHETVLVAAISKNQSGSINSSPSIMNSVVNVLKPLGLETVAYSGPLAQANFTSAFNGDIKSLNSISSSLNPDYFAFIFVELAAVVRLEYQGKAYNIFNTSAEAGIRIMRSDGSIVFTDTKTGIKGQGGSEQAAIDDCLIKAGEELSKLLDSKSSLLKKAFD